MVHVALNLYASLVVNKPTHLYKRLVFVIMYIKQAALIYFNVAAMSFSLST